jgi:hydroxymethylbilane synthase
MASITKLRLGTRPSQLAMAQSRLVIADLNKHHPNLDIQLIALRTRGDVDLKTPLTKIHDPDFFSAELDRALLEGRIDFCVHSYKDLTINRPAEIQLAAIPRRENPADIVVFCDDVEQKLAAGKALRIGSSSLRRQQNTADFLTALLPWKGMQPKLDFYPLRGSVPDRLARITATADNQLDAVVVALAGVQRLWADPISHNSVADVMLHARLMVLPSSECPTAPGQGALAIECRQNDPTTLDVLRSIHDVETAELVATEQRLLENVAHDHVLEPSSIGATAIAHSELGFVARLRGRSADITSQPVYQCRTKFQPQKPATAKPWSLATDTATVRTPLDTELPRSGMVFVAHWHALEHQSLDPAVRCWTSGVKSWQKLARQGIWVEGCTDHLGFASLNDWLKCDVLQLPPIRDWTAVTHVNALKGWQASGVKATLATYRHETESASNFAPTLEGLDASTHFFWRSPQHFERVKHLLPADAHHACGPGKTLRALRAAGIKNVAAFPSHKEWQQWLA